MTLCVVAQMYKRARILLLVNIDVVSCKVDLQGPAVSTSQVWSTYGALHGFRWTSNVQASCEAVYAVLVYA